MAAILSPISQWGIHLASMAAPTALVTIRASLLFRALG